MKPVRLERSFREKPWGRTDLQPWFPPRSESTGEVWFTGDPPLPILVKILFTSAKLSVQVHPEDTDGRTGKTEMWHILQTEPGARIAAGFREAVTRERLLQAIEAGTVETLLQWFPVKAGETYFIPARTVHAIGAGIVACEIQQNSDITYRLYDYGSQRELHVEAALEIADLGRHSGLSRPMPVSEGCERLAECRYFTTDKLTIDGETEYQPDPARFHLLISLEGSGRIGEDLLQPGDVWLVPGGASPFQLGGAGVCRILRTFVTE
jgi:mannose-6-phosphate isomerase